MDISAVLTSWYLKNKRDLPWRDTTNPYHIWLSEIILQQTRVEQGLPYYLNFTKNYKNIKVFAKAPQEDILKLWQGLGYYSRARNMHHTAQLIVNNHNAVFPDNYDDLLKLKGIGPYTGAAIASFAFNEAKAVVDGNVYRVLARYYGIDTPINSTEGKKLFDKLAVEILNTQQPALHNQAIMEFGALQCKPVNPNCNICPLITSCTAYAKGLVNTLPVKTKKIKVKNRYLHYLEVHAKTDVLIKQRKGKEIWQGLHDFPCIENPKLTDVDELIKDNLWHELCGKSFTIESVSKTYKHILSHQHLHAIFIKILVKKLPALKNNAEAHYFIVPKTELKKYAIPRLIDKYLIDEKYY